MDKRLLIAASFKSGDWGSVCRRAYYVGIVVHKIILV